MWSIHTWCALFVTLIESSSASVNRMFLMITLLPGRVVEPSWRPPPVISAVVPTPRTLLFATTVSMPDTWMRPDTWITYAPALPT